MKKLLFSGIGLLAAVAVLQVGQPASATAAGDAPVMDKGKVGICHFPGHRGDFVLGNQQRGTPKTACEARGGLDIFVGAKACERGHRAAEAPGGNHAGKTCSDF